MAESDIVPDNVDDVMGAGYVISLDGGQVSFRFQLKLKELKKSLKKKKDAEFADLLFLSVLFFSSSLHQLTCRIAVFKSLLKVIAHFRLKNFVSTKNA